MHFLPDKVKKDVASLSRYHDKDATPSDFNIVNAVLKSKMQKFGTWFLVPNFTMKDVNIWIRLLTSVKKNINTSADVLIFLGVTT